MTILKLFYDFNHGSYCYSALGWMYPVPTAVGVEVVFVRQEPYESSSWSQVSLETRLLQITWLATAIKYKPLHHLVLQDGEIITPSTIC